MQVLPFGLWRVLEKQIFPFCHMYLESCISSKYRNEDVCDQFGSDCHICDPFLKKPLSIQYSKIF